MRRQKYLFSDPKVIEKAKKTNLEIYGVEYASQNSEDEGNNYLLINTLRGDDFWM
jgi:hypothetical protein